jgi:dGTPase
LFASAVVRELIDWQMTDLLDQTRANLQRHGVCRLEDVRAATTTLVSPSTEVRQGKAELEAFLHRCVYQHYRVARMSAKGARIVRGLFQEFLRLPELLPAAAQPTNGTPLPQALGDYLAGLTDRSAAEEYHALFHPRDGE